LICCLLTTTGARMCIRTQFSLTWFVARSLATADFLTCFIRFLFITIQLAQTARINKCMDVNENFSSQRMLNHSVSLGVLYSSAAKVFYSRGQHGVVA
jgi:hypothetical protein